MTEAKLISPKECANSIIEITNNYQFYSKNAIHWAEKVTDYNLFILELKAVIPPAIMLTSHCEQSTLEEERAILSMTLTKK